MIFFDELTDKTKELIFRILSSLLSGFLFLNVLPTFMFIIYMREKIFFSYDLFTSGLFGINVFFFYGIIIILLFSLLMTSSIFFGIGLLIQKKCNKNKVPKYCKNNDLKKAENNQKINKENEILYLVIFIGFIVINIFSLYGLWEKNQQFFYELLFFLSICSILTFHFAIVVFTKAKFSIISLIISFPLSISILFLNSDWTADIVSHGLKSFNSSQKEVNIKSIDNKLLLSGTLLLLSPQNVFILIEENNETNRTQIIKRDNIIIDIKN